MYVYSYIHIYKNLLLTFFYVLHKSPHNESMKECVFSLNFISTFKVIASWVANHDLCVLPSPLLLCVFVFRGWGWGTPIGIIQITWKNNHIYFPCKCLVLIDMSLYDGLTLQLTIEKSIKSHCFGGLISSFIFSSSPNEDYF